MAKRSDWCKMEVGFNDGNHISYSFEEWVSHCSHSPMFQQDGVNIKREDVDGETLECFAHELK